MSNPVIDEFISKHYEEVSSVKGLSFSSSYPFVLKSSRFIIPEGHSTVLVSRKERLCGLVNMLVLNQSKTQFRINVGVEVSELSGYQPEFFRKFTKPDVISLEDVGFKEDLDLSYRNLTSSLIFALSFGEVSNLNDSEMRYYDEYMGRELPLDFLIKKGLLTRDPFTSSQEFTFDEFFPEWVSTEGVENIQVYSKFGNGPLQRKFQNLRVPTPVYVNAQ